MFKRICSITVAIAAAAFALVPRESAAQEPIRVGFLTIKSGPLAAGGRQMEEGLTLFLKERNYTLAGRKVELFTADTAGQPAQTKTKAQELVERDKVQVIIGPLAAFEAIAIDDYIRQVKMPIISSAAAAEDLTQRKANPWFVRAANSSAQPNHPLGEYAAKTLGYKRVATVGDDFAFGHEVIAGFQRAFEDNGGKVVQKLWSPLNVADYGTYITQLKPDVDAVFISFAGANGPRFLKQYHQYGMKTPVISNMTAVDEGVLKTMGDEALGVVSSGWYSAAIDNPYNKAFVQAINRDYGVDPGVYTVGAFASGLMLEHALRAVKGRIEDRDAFMKALRAVVVDDDPRGMLRLDDYGNPVINVYIRKVERKDGKLVNTVIKTYPAVSQFWTYDPKQFLAQPVYSRDYPPAKNLE